MKATDSHGCGGMTGAPTATWWRVWQRKRARQNRATGAYKVTARQAAGEQTPASTYLILYNVDYDWVTTKEK